MSQNRRRFLAASGLAGAANLLPAGGPRRRRRGPPPARRSRCRRASASARCATAAGCRRSGLRTKRGVLDVKRAEAQYRTGAPVLIDDVIHGRGNLAALGLLLDRAVGDAGAGRFFVAEAEAAFGPCVTDPEKIICVGLNYRAHAAEANQKPPEVPILFNKFNSALNHHRGTINVSEENAKEFDYEAELVLVIGRTARNVPEDRGARTMSSAMPAAMTSRRASCSDGRRSGCSARPAMAGARSAPGWSPPTRWTRRR